MFFSGPMKKETGEAHSLLARIFSDLGDYQQAIANQRKAVIILERFISPPPSLRLSSLLPLPSALRLPLPSALHLPLSYL
jgi:hypothetical protein